MIIYKHTSKTSGKSYIGLTKFSLEERFDQHVNESNRGSSKHFHSAINKYGSDDFVSEELASGITTLEEANKLEQLFIEKFDTFNSGYNMTLGGDTLYSSTRGKTYEEIYKGDTKRINDKKKIISKVHTGKIVSDETKQKMKDSHWSNNIENTWNAEYQTGVPLPEEHKKNISSGGIRRYANMTDDEMKALSERNSGKNNPNYGKKHSEETKKKISEISKIKVQCPHCEMMISKGMAKRWHFDKCKRKINEN